MSRNIQVKNQSVVKPTNAKSLMTVPFENGFHFYTAIGKDTGITATNLSEFAAKLQTIPMESVVFHFQRKDFEKWLRYTIKDVALAETISRTKGDQPTEDLRRDLLKTVETGISRTL
jgi:hypothetical protein